MTKDLAHRFLDPKSPRQRRYEALRARFVEGCPTEEAARRFGYSHGSFRNLCSQFINAEDPDFLFPAPARVKPLEDGPADGRAERRQRVLELRRQDLSIHDIRRRLAEEGNPLSVGTIQKLLSEAGLSRLPRRRPDQMPAVARAPTADRNALDLAPRQLRTAFGGLFLFAPDLARMDLGAVTANLPGSGMIPADCALRALLALKLWGIGRKGHVMPEILDEGIALFAGLNAMPKRATLTEYSCRVDPRRLGTVMDAWHRQVAGLDASSGCGGSFDLDFHTIPYHGDEALVEKHYVSKRSRRQKGVLAFLVRNAGTRSFAWANATVTRDTQNDEVLRFVEAWEQRTGQLPAELVFDSRLTTYANLARLDAMGIDFITLRRRSAGLVSALLAEPPEAWRRVSLTNIARRFRTPRILEQMVSLRGCPEPVRQIAVRDLGHDKPTLLITNQLDASPRDLIDRYARRMVIENTIADAIDFFHMDALSAVVPMKIDVDVQLTVMASALYRILARRIGNRCENQEPAQLFRKFVNASANVEITEDEIIVSYGRRTYNPFLAEAGLFETAETLPWLEGRTLRLRAI